MARRKQKHTKKAATKMTLQQREVKAKNALENGYYQKAIVNLRQMLKEDDRAEWQEDARYAHHQLAEQLSHTKKYRDVVSLYESGAKLCDFSLYTFEYVEALLASKQFDKATRYYLALQESEKNVLQAIRAELAAYALAGEVKIIKQLPDNDPVVIDYEPALKLLSAYCATDDVQVEKQLKLISFRSPYRDLRQIIAAAIKLDHNDEGATGNEQLARIAPESAFSALANTLQLSSQKPEQLLASWASLSTHQQQFVKQVKGWGKEKDKQLKKLASLVTEPTFSEVFRLADTFRASVPDYFNTLAKKATVHAIALNNRAITLKRFKQRFPQPSGSASVADDFHLKALVESLKFKQGDVDPFDPFWKLAEAWELYRGALAKSANDKKRQALVYRYLVEMMLRKMDDFDERLAGYIEQSLVLDPLDKASHIQLIRYYLDNKNVKQTRESVDCAVKHFPDDLAILLLAIESAIAGNAFKKAANYAKTLLAVDPINREAQRLLCQAHLAHSRKQVKTKKWHLVEKELKEAEQWANDPIIKAIIALQTAIMLRAQSENNSHLVIELLKQTQLLMETDLNTRFLIRLETLSVNRKRDAKPLHKLIKLNWLLSKVQQKTVLFSFMEQVNRCAVMYDSKAISEVLSQLSPVLKTIIKKEISLAEYEKILDFWQRYEQDSILQNYVKAALKQYGQSPMLTYYRYVNTRRLKDRAYNEVDLAIDEAQEQGDTVIASRLISLLRMQIESSPFGGFDFMDDGDVFEPRKGKGSSPVAMPAPLQATIIQLIQHSDIDDVVSNMSEVLRIPEEQLSMLKETIGEDALRVLLVGLLKGENPQAVGEMMESSIADNQEPKKKKGFFGLFDFFGD